MSDTGPDTTIIEEAWSPRRKTPAAPPGRVGHSGARERLLKAASDLMCDGDTINVSVRDVATRSALNSSLIGYYFGNKDRLLLEVAEHDILPVIAAMRAIADEDGSAEGRLRRIIGVMIVALHRFPYINRLLMAMLRDFAPDHSRLVATDLVLPLSRSVIDVVEDGIRRGEFVAFDPLFVWHSLAGACTQIFSGRASLLYVHGRGPLDGDERDRYGEQVASIFLEGMRRRSA